MKRIASGSQAAALPTHPAGTGTPGYFADAATTPSDDPTEVTPEWCNAVQECLVRTIEDGGGTPATDFDLFKNTVAGVHGIKAHATTLTNVTTPKTRAVVNSTSSTASAAKALVAASSGGVASGEESMCLGTQGTSTAIARNAAVIASNAGLAGAAQAVVLGCDSATASGAQSVCIGGTAQNATAARTAVVGGTSGAASAADAGTFAGDNPTASGLKAVAVGGHDLTASGENGAAVGGDTNIAGALDSFVGGGSSHDVQSGATGGAVLGGLNHTISGARSVAMGGDSHQITGADSFALGGEDGTIAAAQSGAIATDTCIILDGSGKPNKVLVASLGATLESDGDPTGGGADGYCLAGGHTNDPLGGAANVDLTWSLSSKHGTLTLDDTTLIAGADYAELFPNATPGVIPPGSLVARQGKSVRLARPGDRVLGVVSAAPSVVGNAAGLSWSGAKLRDEWGALIYQDVEVCRFETTDEEGVVYKYQGLVSKCPVEIPDDAERWVSRDPVRNPDFDPIQPYTARRARPESWTCVALLGQVRVRIASGVEEGDYLTPGADGCAVGTLARPDGRPVEVMEITTPYDPAKGYGVALCLVG